jgi:hypothetical protein
VKVPDNANETLAEGDLIGFTFVLYAAGQLKKNGN